MEGEGLRGSVTGTGDPAADFPSHLGGEAERPRDPQAQTHLAPLAPWPSARRVPDAAVAQILRGTAFLWALPKWKPA